MNAKNFKETFVFIAVSIVLLMGIYVTQNSMNAIRKAEKLTADEEIFENAPPAVAVTTVALGAFRGLVADWLWLRSNKMQDEGAYFEMVQLASWIVKLQPRFTGATAFLAWNMAYNVSVTFKDHDDRWRWVSRGIELIRDEALELNPGDPELFKELGWIYQHKMGQDMDDANKLYKTNWAKEMMRLFGSYPPDWEELLNAPSTIDEMLEQSDISEEAFKKILGERSVDGLETEFRDNKYRFSEERFLELSDAGLARELDLYFRRRAIERDYKLDLSIIDEINKKYGELDWRHPSSHALYWAYRGLKVAEGETYKNCDRMVFQSLNQAFKTGRIIYVEETDYLEMAPNVNILESVKQAYLTAEQKHGSTMMKGGYENFLVDATTMLYTFGYLKEAEEFRQAGRERYGRRFGSNLDRFVLNELFEDIGSAGYNQAQSIVQGYLFQMCRSLAIQEQQRAEALERLAKGIWNKYMSEIGESTHTRRGLPPFNQMKKNTVVEALKRFDPYYREVLREQLPEEYKDLDRAAGPRIEAQ